MGNFSQHVKLCKIYSKFIENVENGQWKQTETVQNGHKCRICDKAQSKNRIYLYHHIRNCKGKNYNLFESELSSLLAERNSRLGKAGNYRRKLDPKQKYMI